MRKREHFLGIHADNSFLSYNMYGWPVRSVERLPPFSPKQLKNPVLVMGTSVRASRPQT